MDLVTGNSSKLDDFRAQGCRLGGASGACARKWPRTVAQPPPSPHSGPRDLNNFLSRFPIPSLLTPFFTSFPYCRQTNSSPVVVAVAVAVAGYHATGHVHCLAPWLLPLLLLMPLESTRPISSLLGHYLSGLVPCVVDATLPNPPPLARREQCLTTPRPEHACHPQRLELT